ncbi:MAG: hypothetical protein HYR56_24830 [Acidobacteria bacterium]|nr:hypothetical protein [Acidobacteriota bacterium]MBI3428138.1 hypothetical protein [Acidobacteriota bacterium]
MTEHLSTIQFEAYQQQRLAPAELIAVDDHLTACAACRQRLEAALPTTAIAFYSAWQAEENAPHLSFDQLAAYVENTLTGDEQQFGTDHLATCAHCVVAAADLRAFKVEAAPVPARVPPPVAAGWWDKVRALLSPIMPVPAFGFAVAGLLLIVLLGWLWRAVFVKPTPAPQLAQQTATPSVTPVLTLTPTPAAAPLLAQLNDGGGQITLDQQERLAGVEGLSPAYQQMVKTALMTQQIAKPATLTGLNRPGSSLMGADEQGNQFALRAPVGKVVLTDRPLFLWAPLAGAVSYLAEIYDERFSLVRKSGELKNTQWLPSEPLARGQLYAWQVKANKDGQEVIAPKPPAAQARFRVLAQTPADEIARVRRTHGNAHLLLGLLCAQAGLLDEAEKELRVLQAANPDAASVRRLLANVQALRR